MRRAVGDGAACVQGAFLRNTAGRMRGLVGLRRSSMRTSAGPSAKETYVHSKRDLLISKEPYLRSRMGIRTGAGRLAKEESRRLSESISARERVLGLFRHRQVSFVICVGLFCHIRRSLLPYT